MQDEFLRLQPCCNKTIVFITHDFDEAIRLADRIAIMRDGADRCRSARRRNWSSARPTAYVAEFTRDVPQAQGPVRARRSCGLRPARRRSPAASRADATVADFAAVRRAQPTCRSPWSTARASRSAWSTRAGGASTCLRLDAGELLAHARRPPTALRAPAGIPALARLRSSGSALAALSLVAVPAGREPSAPGRWTMPPSLAAGRRLDRRP